MTVIADHSAVKSVLETPGSNGKHARWWLKVFGCGMGQVKIVYRPGHENAQADALSRNPLSSADDGQVDIEAHVMQTSALQDTDISELLDMPRPQQEAVVNNFHLGQRKDCNLRELCDYLEHGVLPETVRVKFTSWWPKPCTSPLLITYCTLLTTRGETGNEQPSLFICKSKYC